MQVLKLANSRHQQQQAGWSVDVPPGAPTRGSVDLSTGVRVIVPCCNQGLPAAQHGNAIRALWVCCYDAHQDKSQLAQFCHGFLLCDNDSFQLRQPLEVIGTTKLFEDTGYSKPNIACIRLAQAWTSAPGGPTHAEGTSLRDVSQLQGQQRVGSTS
jgi:hypothetical protein